MDTPSHRFIQPDTQSDYFNLWAAFIYARDFLGLPGHEEQRQAAAEFERLHAQGFGAPVIRYATACSPARLSISEARGQQLIVNSYRPTFATITIAPAARTASCASLTSAGRAIPCDISKRTLCPALLYRGRNRGPNGGREAG